MAKTKARKYLDSLSIDSRRPVVFDFALSRFVLKYKKNSTLYSRSRISTNFYTDQSKLYFTQEDLWKIRRGEKVVGFSRTVDGLFNRVSSSKSKYIPDLSLDLYTHIHERYKSIRNYWEDLFSGSVQGVSMTRMWNISIVSSLIFGMFLMTMIYRYLGQGASAGSREAKLLTPSSAKELVLGEEKEKMEVVKAQEKDLNAIVDTTTSSQDIKKSFPLDESDDPMEEKMREMVKGYPIERMVPEIAKKDKVVAAFMISMAKKESDWGKRVPVLKGQDCYNYWGFRAKRKRMGTGGHTCFDSPKDAVDSVARRVEELVYEEKLNTPGKMVEAWKCGYDCSWDNPKAVKKWVSDVEKYFKPLNSAK